MNLDYTTWNKILNKLRNWKHFFISLYEVIKNGYPARKLIVIGVTGTDGKTTTSHLIYEMLKASGPKVALVSTVGAYIAGEEINTGFHVTTPDAKFLQPFIRKVVNAGMTHLVLETTSHGLDQHRTLGCNFTVGVITNITHEHLDYHKTFEKYRNAKAKLLRHKQFAVLNRDDGSFRWLVSKCKRGCKVIPFGKSKRTINNPALRAEYNRYNVDAAEAVARIFRIDENVISQTIQNFSGAPGRNEEINLGQNFRAIVDFAHTPNALELFLKDIKKVLPKKKKLIVVFGCAGLRDVLKRPLMGNIAAQLADKVIVTAEDPRTESLDTIFRQIIEQIPDPILRKKIIREDDRQKAINLAVKLARPGDILVVTGKGHEQSMCFGTKERPWSDREAVKKAIRRS